MIAFNALRAEERRQAAIIQSKYELAIKEARAEIGQSCARDAIFAALAGHVAQALAAVESPQMRKALRRAFERALTDATRELQAQTIAKARTIFSEPKARAS